MANDQAWLLLVEPDLMIRHPLAEYLRECGYRVAEAGDSDEALVLLSAPRPAIDLVLCDIQTPGKVDGFGLAKWVREHAPQVRVILAGTVAKAAEKAGDICEEGPVLAKPYDHRLLLDRIKRGLASRDQSARQKP